MALGSTFGMTVFLIKCEPVLSVSGIHPMKCHPGHAQDCRRSDKRNLTRDPEEARWRSIYEMHSCGSRGVPKLLNAGMRPRGTGSNFAYLSSASPRVPGMTFHFFYFVRLFLVLIPHLMKCARAT